MFVFNIIESLSSANIFFSIKLCLLLHITWQILNNFLHTEYGGPGTLMVVPFIDMADVIREKDLPGASQATRAAVVWAQNNIDKDWKEWTGEDSD
jgi:hypothetical protein